VTTIANDFAALMQEGIPKETDKVERIEEVYERIGTNLGRLIRFGTEFDPKLISAQ
jgi:hypothetical protein